MTRSLHQTVQVASALAFNNGTQDLGLFTKDYGLAVGFYNPDDEKNRKLSYLLVNRVTGVVEGAGSLFALMINQLFQAQAALDACRLRYMHKPVEETLQ